MKAIAFLTLTLLASLTPAQIRPIRPPHPILVVSGTVGSVYGSTFVLNTQAGSYKVAITPSTTFLRSRMSQAAGVRPGEAVTVRGTMRQQILTALSIRIVSAPIAPIRMHRRSHMR